MQGMLILILNKHAKANLDFLRGHKGKKQLKQVRLGMPRLADEVASFCFPKHSL
jgi:hypothetical protein